MDEMILKRSFYLSAWEAASPLAAPGRAVRRLCPRPGAACLQPLAAHSRRAGRGQTGNRGRPRRGAPHPLMVTPPPPPPLRVRPRQILSKGDRSSTGKDSARFRNVEIRLGAATAASAARRAPARAAPGGVRREGAGPGNSGGWGRGARTEPEAAGSAARPIPSQPDELSR